MIFEISFIKGLPQTRPGPATLTRLHRRGMSLAVVARACRLAGGRWGALAWTESWDLEKSIKFYN